MENIIVFAVIAAAAGYAVWRVIRAARGERCCGCEHCRSAKPDCCSSEDPRA